MKTIYRILSGVFVGGIMNGLLWGGFSAIRLALIDLHDDWILFMFLSFGFFGLLCGAVIGFFVGLINARKIVSAIGGGLAAFVITIFVMFENSPADKNLTLMNLTFVPFVFSLFTAFTCCLIVIFLNRGQTNKYH